MVSLFAVRFSFCMVTLVYPFSIRVSNVSVVPPVLMRFLSLPMLPFLPEMPLTGRLLIAPPLRVQRTIPSDWPVSVQELDCSTPAEYLDLGSCTKVCEYRIITIATDNAGRIQAVIFDRAGKQLLGMICKELAANEDPIKTMYSVMGKEAYMGIQLQHDMKMCALKCVVNKVIYPAAKNTEPVSSGLSLVR
ncbi:hypothetical protein Hanom_Chr02g00129161 [Helianthus anomalus]